MSPGPTLRPEAILDVSLDLAHKYRLFNSVNVANRHYEVIGKFWMLIARV